MDILFLEYKCKKVFKVGHAKPDYAKGCQDKTVTTAVTTFEVTTTELFIIDMIDYIRMGWKLWAKVSREYVPHTLPIGLNRISWKRKIFVISMPHLVAPTDWVKSD